MSRAAPYLPSTGLYAPPLTPSSSGTSGSTVAAPAPAFASASALPPAAPPPSASRLMLRVNTDTRARSNSANSPVARFFDSNQLPHHSASRSLSLAPVSPGAAGAHAHTPGGTPMSDSQTLPHAGAAPRGVSPAPTAGSGSADTPGLPPAVVIQNAIAESPDRGETLDLSRSKLDYIGDAEVELFRRGAAKDIKGVWRLALSYNNLRDNCLSSSFAKLHRLRYLNLKGNFFTEFPPEVSLLPSLEILDISKNRVTTFPSDPGRLVRLKVLSLSQNFIYTLPTYLTAFDELKVFKIDGNPIQWPPQEVLGPLLRPEPSASKAPADGSDPPRRKDEDNRPWIANMKSWMRTRANETDRLLERSRTDDEAYFASEEEPVSAVTVSTDNGDDYPWRPTDTVKRVVTIADGDGDSPSAPARPVGQRQRAATVSAEALVRPSSSSLSLPSQASRHDRSVSSSSLTPPASASTSSSTHSRHLAVAPPPPQHAAHARGASYTSAQRLSGSLTAKKSLPDLRLSHARIIEDRREAGSDSNRPLGLAIVTDKGGRHHVPVKSWGENQLSLGSTATVRGLDDDYGRMARTGSVDPLRRTKATVGADMLNKRGSQDGPEMDESRNSYFRRLSMLPASTISKSVSPALLRFVDAVRGILFALTQFHSALRQFLLFAVSDRVASVFARVMDPASGYLTNLINALDRFDSVSRRQAPPVQAVRAVIDSAKESIAVFGKVVAILKLQLATLKDTDVRFTRQLLLNVYGSMAEVACSWQTMAPLLAEVFPLLTQNPSGHKKVLSTSLGRTPISPIPERGESHSPESAARSVSASAPSPLYQVQALESPVPLRTAKARRQAGSFSSQDVEKGMLMGPPGASMDAVRRRPSEMDIAEQAEDASDEGQEQLSLPPATPVEHDHHVVHDNAYRNGGVGMEPTRSQQSTFSRRGHMPTSSAGSSHALSVGLGPGRKLSVDVRPVTPASATLFDDDLLDVIETATEVAFTVWLRLAEELGTTSPPVSKHAQSDSTGSAVSGLGSARLPAFTSAGARPPAIPPRAHAELVQLLSHAEQVTTVLRESTMALRANPTGYARGTLPDDAQAFIKTVVRVSELVKAVSAHHTFGAHVRQSLSRLTQATRECAILMQVSSLRPGSATPGPGAHPHPHQHPHQHPHRQHYPHPHLAHTQHRADSPPRHRAASSSSDSLASATYAPPPSATWRDRDREPAGGETRDGLRGLQLPSRQAALGRARAHASPPVADPRYRDRDEYETPPSVRRTGVQHFG